MVQPDLYLDWKDFSYFHVRTLKKMALLMSEPHENCGKIYLKKGKEVFLVRDNSLNRALIHSSFVLLPQWCTICRRHQEDLNHLLCKCQFETTFGIVGREVFWYLWGS